jgi:hypothetical protein
MAPWQVVVMNRPESTAFAEAILELDVLLHGTQVSPSGF